MKFPPAWCSKSDGLYLYSEEEIFGEPRAHRKVKPRVKGAALLNLEELRPGDHVVHLDHGIAQYRGLKHMKVADTEGDFLNLEYAANDTMYVPVERINLVQRYIGGRGQSAAEARQTWQRRLGKGQAPHQGAGARDGE